MHITQLPTEIIAQIFQELPIESLCECLRVCKSLSVEAARICYNGITLSNRHKYFLNTITNGRLGDYVRVLTFSFESRDYGRLDQKEFELLLANLPLLTTIRFEITSRISVFLEYLMSVPLDLLSTIQNLIIPSSFILKPAVFNDYLLITQRLRSNITSLCLDNFCVPYFDSKPSNVLAFLSQFPNLKTLLIMNTSNFGVYGISFMSVLCACPQLTLLDLTSEFADMDELPSTNTRNTSLEVLKLKVQDLTPINIDYLLQTSIKEFHFQTGKKRLDQWLQTTSQDHIQKLVHFLKSIKSVSLHMASNIQQDNEAESESKFDLLPTWNFIHQLYHDRLVYSLSIWLSGTTQCLHHIKLDQTTLSVHMSIPPSCLVMPNCIDASFVNEISIRNFEDEVLFDFEHVLAKIMNGCNKQRLWSVKLSNGKKTISIDPFDKKRRLPLFKSWTIAEQYDALPIDKMEIITFQLTPISNTSLKTIASIHPKATGIVFSKCFFTNCTIVGADKYLYDIDLNPFIHIKTVYISMDIDIELDQFFVQVEYAFNVTVCYQCTSGQYNQCDPSVLEKTQETFIISIQSAQLEEILLKTRILRNEPFRHQILLPYLEE